MVPLKELGKLILHYLYDNLTKSKVFNYWLRYQVFMAEIIIVEGFLCRGPNFFINQRNIDVSTSGASAGTFEAFELRDKDSKRYFSKGLKML